MSAIRVMQLGSPTGLYGAERWILALLRNLDRQRFEPIVGVIRDDPSLEAALCLQANAYGFESHIVEAPGRVNFSAVSQLRRYILDRGVNILHTHGYKTDIIGLLAARGTPCRTMSTPHGWSTQAGFALRMYEALDRAIFPFFDSVVPLSEGIHEELVGRAGLRGKLHLIRNGVDIAEIDATQTVAAEIETWKREGQFVVGYIGQLISRKGLDVLLKSFARLPVVAKKLALIGEGPQRAELEALATDLGIRNDVVFFGFRPDRLTFLRGFDVFALPSRLEGIPRCLMESMAANVPIVASDIPGCRDLISDSETGLLFPLDNEDALLAKLQMCLDDGLRARLARNGREHVLREYSAAAMARKYEDLYLGLVNGPA